MAANATAQAIFPASMLSCPNSGPIVLSSSNCIGAGNAPARSKIESSADSVTEKFPVI